jgi:hypothetical protein
MFDLRAKASSGPGGVTANALGPLARREAPDQRTSARAPPDAQI